MDCKNITNVSIPNSVTNIGENAFGYYILRNNGNMTIQKVKNYTIYGYKGSEAERYANDNQFIFVPINDTQSILGDADGDRLITILDATTIQRALASYDVPNPKTVRTCGDIDGYGLDIIDATLIQRYLANYYIPYNIGNPIE